MSVENFLNCLQQWRLEERGDLNRIYFYQAEDVARVETGDFYYVVGRKGSGKTAVAEHLINLNSYNTFSDTLCFGNFPYTLLSKYQDEGYPTSSRYINIWKYVIYCSLIRLFKNNQAIDPDVRGAVARSEPDTVDRALAGYIRHITDNAGSMKIFNFGIGGNRSYHYVTNDTPIAERVQILENIIERYIDTSRYYLIFDDMDDDFSADNAQQDSDYIRLLASLFKAIHDIRTGRLGHKNIFPVLVLREDIFNIIRDNNKTKWLDNALRLHWPPEDLLNMIKFRVDAARKQSGTDLDYETVIARFVEHPQRVRKKARSRTLFHAINRQSYSRPRDFIAFYRIAARKALRMGEQSFSHEVVERVKAEYSKHVLNELIDESYNHLPKINDVLRILSSTGTPSLPYSRAVDLLNAERARLDGDPAAMIEQLVNLSILGKSLPVPNQWEYMYQNEHIHVRPDDRLYFHPSLHAALRV